MICATTGPRSESEVKKLYFYTLFHETWTPERLFHPSLLKGCGSCLQKGLMTEQSAKQRLTLRGKLHVCFLSRADICYVSYLDIKHYKTYITSKTFLNGCYLVLDTSETVKL